MSTSIPTPSDESTTPTLSPAKVAELQAKYITPDGMLRTKNNKQLPLHEVSNWRAQWDEAALGCACMLLIVAAAVLYFGVGCWRYIGWVCLAAGTLTLLIAAFPSECWKVTVSHDGKDHEIENFVKKTESYAIMTALLQYSTPSSLQAPFLPPSPVSHDLRSTPTTTRIPQPLRGTPYKDLRYSGDPAYIAKGEVVGALRRKVYYQAQGAWQSHLQVSSSLFERFVADFIAEMEAQPTANSALYRTLSPDSMTNKRTAGFRFTISKPGRFDAHCEVVFQDRSNDILVNVSPYLIMRRSLGRKALWMLTPLTAPFTSAAVTLVSVASDSLGEATARATSSVPLANPHGFMDATALAEAATLGIHAVRARLVSLHQPPPPPTSDFPDVL